MNTVTLCVLEVVSPQRSNLVLTTDIPNRETNILILHRLNIETFKTQSIKEE